jgi:DASS family divalent anion:Na+ symporter
VVSPLKSSLNLQLSLLGKPSWRELATSIILLLTVVGWNIAPNYRIDAGVITLLSLIAVLIIGVFSEHSLKSLDWNFLIFYGVVLAIGDLMVSLNIDTVVVENIRRLIGDREIGPLAFVLGISLITIIVRLVLPAIPAILLLGLALVPIAPLANVEPWVAIIVIVASHSMWFYPSAVTAYMAAYTACEERLFSHRQARNVAFGFCLVTLGSLVLTIPYWQLLGLL